MQQLAQTVNLLISDMSVQPPLTLSGRACEATTLLNIGLAYSAQGEQAAALACYEQALRLWREVGDRAGEATALYNIAMVHIAQDRLAEAEQLLAQVVALDEAIDQPTLERDRAVLARVQAMLQ